MTPPNLSWSVQEELPVLFVTFTADMDRDAGTILFWAGSNNFYTFILYPERVLSSLITPIGPGSRDTLSETASRLKSTTTPSRLIDVGYSMSSVRVINTKDLSIESYATLSHCWGDLKVVQLNKDTMPTLFHEISTATLPTTFAHAVEVVRFLGLRYLWIDSLCILQDSTQDWETESSKMGSIYRHAYINIAASSAKDSSGGLFFDRDASNSKSQIRQAIPVTLGSAKDNVNSTGMQPGKYHLVDQHLWGSGMANPLNARAWVMQERLLSPRILHFTQDKIYWECLEEKSCEGLSTLRGDLIRQASTLLLRTEVDITRLRNIVVSEAPGTCSTDWYRKFHVAWDQLVERYSKCGLTKEGDKLIAVHGLINRLKDAIPDRCHAGHWESQMPASLCWHVNWGDPDASKTPIHHRRPHEWLAPSWSWASVKVPVCCRILIDGINVVDVVTIKTSCLGNGKLQSSQLRLRGALYTAVVEKGTGCWISDFEEGHEHILINGISLCVDGVYLDDYPSGISHFFILPVVERRENFEESSFLYCLMLEPARTGRGAFVRKGVAMIRLNNSYQETFSRLAPTSCCAVESKGWNMNIIDLL
ncbi:HET-domain-containing [Fusarium acutatum]|uniref:HET-domain-containing n=1 Tax=Fusarium acutatum TaxID=78861 RepID=A0A8H4K173_9HYPO|nr:HET-domain-containing [Fusarium acutatum]